MAGLYIHIPFCASRCIYCGFYSTTRLELRQKYVDAVCREMVLRGTRNEERGARSEEEIDTIYLGGGTPSQLSIPQLEQLFIYINKVYNISPSSFLVPPSSIKEVTIEANPDDVTADYAAALRQLGVNRVSMGAQTFCDERLRFLHRRHTAAQVPVAIEHLRKAGIHNISIDLMYGFPNETLDDWRRDIEAALSLDVEHLSAYSLMIEEGTALERTLTLNDGSLRMPDEELERQMFEMLTDRLTAAGYEHYEISNFAKPSFRSRHNSSYWHGVPYIGLGAAAHSYDGQRRRQWNISDLKQYIEGIENGHPRFDYEDLDDDTLYNEQVMTALRTCEGLPLASLSPAHRTYCMSQAQRFLDDGLLTLHDDHLILTRRALFVSNMIMSQLMQV